VVSPPGFLLLLPYVGHCATIFEAREWPSRLLLLVPHLRPLDAPVQLARFSWLVVVVDDDVVLVLVAVLSSISGSLKTQA
jgi:hypothetical protein